MNKILYFLFPGYFNHQIELISKLNPEMFSSEDLEGMLFMGKYMSKLICEINVRQNNFEKIDNPKSKIQYYRLTL